MTTTRNSPWHPPLPTDETRFVVVVFLSTAAIPDSGDSPAPYFLHLAVPFFVVKGLREVIDRGRYTCEREPVR